MIVSWAISVTKSEVYNGASCRYAKLGLSILALTSSVSELGPQRPGLHHHFVLVFNRYIVSSNVLHSLNCALQRV